MNTVRVIEDNLAEYQSLTAYSGAVQPRHELTLIAAHQCGDFHHGVAIAACLHCGTPERYLVAFSCKRRGVCVRCNQRRMIQTASLLVDYILPEVRYRQWVLVFPKWLRALVRAHPTVQSYVLRTFFSLLQVSVSARLGAISFEQRFGGSLNAHFHYHIIATDGGFDEGGEFIPSPYLDSAIRLDLVEALRKRLLRYLRRQGLIERSTELTQGELRHCGGFSIDGSVMIRASDRKGLEKLIRYCARPAFSDERLTIKDNGRVIYTCQRGQRLNLSGAFAPNSRLRSTVGIGVSRDTPPSRTEVDPQLAQDRPRSAGSQSWAKLLNRNHPEDVPRCSRCDVALTIVAMVMGGAALSELFRALGLSPARRAIRRRALDPPVDSQGMGNPEFTIDPDYGWEFDQTEHF